MRFPLLAAAIGLFSLSLTAHADLTGDTLHVVYYFPDTSTVNLNLGDVTAPSGNVEVTGGIGHFNVSGNQITVTSDIEQTFYSAAFNGFVFTVTSGDPMITGLTIDPSSTLFDAQGTFTSNSVSINLQGLGLVSAGDSITYDLTFAPPAATTPEPSSLALLGTGVLGMGGVIRRRMARA